MKKRFLGIETSKKTGRDILRLLDRDGVQRKITEIQAFPFATMGFTLKYIKPQLGDHGIIDSPLNDLLYRSNGVEKMCRLDSLMNMFMPQSRRTENIKDNFYKKVITMGNGFRDDSRNFLNSQRQNPFLFNLNAEPMYENVPEAKFFAKHKIDCSTEDGMFEARLVGEEVYNEKKANHGNMTANPGTRALIAEETADQLEEDYGIRFIGQYTDFYELYNSFDWEAWEMLRDFIPEDWEVLEGFFATLEKYGPEIVQRFNTEQHLMFGRTGGRPIKTIASTKRYHEYIRREYESAKKFFGNTSRKKIYETVEFYNTQLRHKFTRPEEIQKTTNEIYDYFVETEKWLGIG